MSKLRPHAALVVAGLALFYAIGGPSFAANAVKSASHLITGKRIKDNSITSADVQNGSLLKKDFKAGQLPTGARGQQGDTGAQGPKGAPGQDGTDGVQGPPGVVSTQAFNGSIGDITGTGSGDWKFAGPTSLVTITAGQRITATAVMALGASTAVTVNSDICQQPPAGAVTPVGNHLTTAVSTRQPVAVDATFTPTTAGSYTIGACVALSTGQTLDNNNITSGWFIVTN